jgi:hypothetical protein
MPNDLNQERADQLVADVLDIMRRTYTNIGKQATEGIVDTDDSSVSLGEKVRRAKSRVAIILNDSMRSLAAMDESMLQWTVLVAMGAKDDGGNSPSPR